MVDLYISRCCVVVLIACFSGFSICSFDLEVLWGVTWLRRVCCLVYCGFCWLGVGFYGYVLVVGEVYLLEVVFGFLLSGL